MPFILTLKFLFAWKIKCLVLLNAFASTKSHRKGYIEITIHSATYDYLKKK